MRAVEIENHAHFVLEEIDTRSRSGKFCYARYIMISPLASRLGLIFFNRQVHG